MALLCRLIAFALSLSAASGSSLTFDARSAKNRPVSKVIKLLKDMLAQLEQESQADADTIDTMACWCKTNIKEKTESIDAAKGKITDLTTKIEELTAKSASLTVDIKKLEKQKAANQGSLDTATGIREKQLSEFNEEEKDLVESIAALKAAIVVLQKHSTSFLQTGSHLGSVVASVHDQMRKHSSLLRGVLTHKDRRALVSFIQAPEDYFDATPTFKQAYAPGSGQILGILKQMKETFETNLAAAQKEEMADNSAYSGLNQGKKDEIAAGTDQLDKKTTELATTDEENAQAKEDLEDTERGLAADEKFLATVEDQCASMDKTYEERKATRAHEIAACSKALEILSSDDAHDLFTKTFNPEFLQKANSMNSLRRSQASKLLSRVAQKLHSAELSSLAVQIRLDAFTKVKQAIDDMIAALLKEKADEIKHRDYCIDALDENLFQSEKTSREKAAFLTKIEDFELTIKKITEEIDTLKAEVAEMEVQLKRAGEDREKENKDFQLTVEDQRATKKLLVAALKVLKGFYAKEAALVQREERDGQEPPVSFEKYAKNSNSGGVMAMLEEIIMDAETVEREALRAESDAQKAYESYVRKTNKSIGAKEKAITNLSESKAKSEGDLQVANQGLDAADGTLDSLSKAKGELHSGCDFVMKNFDIRQNARDEEVQALRTAKSILSGAKFEAFLQED